MSFNILIVDDSKLARMSVIKAMGTLRPEWTFAEAASAAQALALGSQSPPDIAIVDFNMPDRDGLDLAAALRHDHPGMPIAILSANRQDAIVTRAAAMNAAYLSKPLNQAAFGAFLEVAEASLQKTGR